ncbi:ABC transporter ATP-binding protein [Nitratireductor sp. StC3]|uniref:ABC transporter ATP-binding protein n=1 Tax=Nitratireductor sp. StC3 TaxID=2126741 RepID=UPI000D0D5ABA|nr:ABC transporter ATP-binding protein [Nitratireductor sp. StC3]PSM16589.1 hypothetical protein C7T96_19940 [Nitratireductor sp. StC3]
MAVGRHLAWLAGELWRRRGEFVAALIATAVSAGLYLLMPGWAATLVRSVFPAGETAALAWHLALGLAIFGAASAFTFARVYLMTRLSQRITAAVRLRIFGDILATAPRNLHALRGGELVSSFSNDLQVFQHAMTRVVASLIPAIILVVCFSVAMAWTNWQLFLCAIVLVSPLAWITSRFGRTLHAKAHLSQRRLATLVGRFEETVRGAKELKSYCLEDQSIRQFELLNRDALAVQIERDMMESLHPAAVAMAAALGVSAMLFVSAFMLSRDLISLEDLTAFLVIVGLAYPSLQEGSHSIGQLIQLFAVLERFEVIMGLPREADGTAPPAAAPLRGAIRFDKVRFLHQPGGFAFEDFDLTIPAGQRVAIVGPSGAGKSTLLDLLPRFLAPEAGRVLIDGTDVAAMRLAELRASIGIVFQEPAIFETSLIDNIRLGDPHAPMDRVMEAARSAHVDEFAQRLPGGYDAPVAVRGLNLSLGQRQRIAIARAFLKDPPILMLDEPTSALDTVSEQLVRDAIERVSAGRTTLIVAHRISTVRGVDRIVVLDRGRIVEDGDHETLFRRDGLYRRLYREQMRDVEPGPAAG